MRGGRAGSGKRGRKASEECLELRLRDVMSRRMLGKSFVGGMGDGGEASGVWERR